MTDGVQKRKLILRNWGEEACSVRSSLLFPKLFQRRFNSGFQRCQIVLNRQPHANEIDSVIFVPQEISNGTQLRPRNSGAQLLSNTTEFFRSLTDPFQTALRRIARLRIFREAFKSMPTVNTSIKAMFSTMSSKNAE